MLQSMNMTWPVIGILSGLFLALWSSQRSTRVDQKLFVERAEVVVASARQSR
jgi:hypothetical protein